VHDYWNGLLLKHLVYNERSELTVPQHLEVSVHPCGGYSSTTFGTGSVFETLEAHLQINGTRNGRSCNMNVDWDNIQSITFSHKRPG
jgi:hypothetical protein